MNGDVNGQEAILDSAELAAWRDAVVAGDLPEPTSDRFRPLRGGVVNLWEFEVAEYWFADGRAQLVGRNESGKSTLMTLTTLILLAGDTSPHLIDTLGSSNKRFRYYVEPDGSDEDRRDPSTSTNRGWAWIEFGRIADDRPAYVTCLLYANVKRARESPQLTWAVCEGTARVRQGITLAQRHAVVPPTDACGDPAWCTYPSGTGYRQHLARAVFGTQPQRLDDYMRMLKVIRTPKLGSRLNTAFLREKLREALPPLADHEVAQLADGWEELEKIALDRDSADDARRAVDDFRKRAWWPWAAAEVRRAADALSSANNALDDVTRNAREAKTALVEAEGRLSELKGRIERTAGERRRVEVEHDELKDSQRFKDAETAVATAKSLAERATEMRRIATTRREELGTARLRHDEMNDRLDGLRRKLSAAHQDADDALETTAAETDAVGLDHAREWLTHHDVDRAEVARERRERDATHLQTLIVTADEARKHADHAQKAVEKARAQADGWRKRAEEARTAAETEAQTVVDRIASWCLPLDESPAPTMVERWLEAVQDILVAPRPAPVLAATVARDYLTPRRVAIGTERQHEIATAKAHRTKAAELSDEIDRLRQAGDPDGPVPQGWTRRTRPDPSPAGAPLWRLVDPRPDAPPGAVDQIEAALAAAGLLDLWVNPDGTWSAERDGLEAILSPVAAATTAERSLRSVLDVSHDAHGGVRQVVRRFLDAVTWAPAGESLGATPVALSADGRWRTPIASGRAAPAAGGASLLGTAARRRAIEREMMRLDAGRVAALDAAELGDARVAALGELLDRLGTWEDALPDDRNLVAAVLDARDADNRLGDAERDLAETRSVLAEAVTRADDARSEAATWAADHALPLESGTLATLVTRLRNLAIRLEKLRSLFKDVATAEDAVTLAAGDADKAAAALAETGRKHRDAQQQAADLEHRAATARSLLSGEITDVLDRVERLARRLDELRGESDELGETKVELSVTCQNARNTLSERERAAEQARQSRDGATAVWWNVMDTGPATALGLDTPDNRTFTAALDLARSARGTLRPPQWPERDREGQGRRIDAAWKRLVDETTSLRAVLEAGAGRTVRIVEPADDELPRIEIVVDGTGQGYEPPLATAKLAEQHDELRQTYDDNMHTTLHELLGSTFIEHLRDRLEEVAHLHATINRVLADHPTGTTRTTLRVQRAPVDGDRHATHVLALLQDSSYTYLTPDAQGEVRRFLQLRIDEARDAAQAAGDVDWRDRLADALDYRRWFDTVVEKRSGEAGRWGPLTTGAHGRLSGGASVVTLMLPLVATLAAMYSSTPQGPRPLWLDEAFDGVDKDNRVSILRLLTEFDMDYLLAGPAILVNVSTVPSAAVWEVVRADHPEPGVTLMVSLWAAGTLHMLDAPDGADLAALWPPPTDTAGRLDLLSSPPP